MNYCDSHIQLIKEIDRGNANIDVIKERVINLDKRINGSIDDIRSHIKSGHNWRTTIIGIIVTLVLNAIIFAYCYGQLNQKVVHIEKKVWAEENK